MQGNSSRGICAYRRWETHSAHLFSALSPMRPSQHADVPRVLTVINKSNFAVSGHVFDMPGQLRFLRETPILNCVRNDGGGISARQPGSVR